MILKIKKSKPVSPMPIEVPPSKSHSMRALVLAAFAEIILLSLIKYTNSKITLILKEIRDLKK